MECRSDLLLDISEHLGTSEHTRVQYHTWPREPQHTCNHLQSLRPTSGLCWGVCIHSNIWSLAKTAVDIEIKLNKVLLRTRIMICQPTRIMFSSVNLENSIGCFRATSISPYLPLYI